MGLDDDPRVRELIATSRTWHRVEHHAAVGSTQDTALEGLRAGEATGLVVVADAQHAGRGRQGRPWIDAVEAATGPANLAVTATVPVPPHGVGLVPLAVGLAVEEAYRAAGAQPRLKWPNDVLLDDRKAAGILVERHGLVGDREVLLIGCGLNLDWRGVERTGQAQAWTSLAEALGADVDRGQVLVDLLRGIEGRVREVAADPDAVLADYRPRCATLGTRVRVDRPAGPPLEGVAADLDPAGRLVVTTPEGRRHVVDVGDVAHLRPH